MALDKDQVIEDLAHAVRLLVDETFKKETEIMALGQDILDAVSAETTVIDSFIALVRGLVPNVIPQSTASAILSAIAADKTKLEAAILENTPPPPPAPR